MPGSEQAGGHKTPAAGHVFIKGRQWRCTDPSIPEPLRQQLVNALMDARRAVGAGNKTGDSDAVSAARRRVQSAKVALGERGPKWWLEMSEDDRKVRAESTILALLACRAEDATICPSDAARAVDSSDWRPLMSLVRSVAFNMESRGLVTVQQRGKPVAADARGPVRIGRATASLKPQVAPD